MAGLSAALRAAVGARVVVRVRDGDGARDVLGILRFCDEQTLRVERADGAVEEFRSDQVIVGKPVPAQASVRQRLSAEEVQRRIGLGWRAPEERPLGQWQLRAADGFSYRANSARATGDPGATVADTAAAVTDFYTQRGLTPVIQTPVDSPWADAFARVGWVAPMGEVEVQVASVAQLRRHRRPGGGPTVALSDTLTEAWLASFARERRHGAVARAVLRSGNAVFAQIGELGWARASLAEDWLGLTNLLVAPAARGQGLARALISALTGWGAERGASTIFLQVEIDNAAARGLYRDLGFRTHHRYRYLVPPDRVGPRTKGTHDVGADTPH